MASFCKIAGLIRGFLVTAVLVNFALIDGANAGPVSSYDVHLTVNINFVLPSGVTTGNETLSIFPVTTGSGQLSDNISVDTNPPKPAISADLHVFGSGTGSSSIDMLGSFEFVGPSTPYLIEFAETLNATATTFQAPGGSANASILAISGFMPNLTGVMCPAGVTGFDCFDAENTVAFSYEIKIAGEAFTPTPEPATFALLGVGLAGLGFSRRGRKQ